jgi:hypothetical protein
MPKYNAQGVEHGVAERDALLLLRGEHRVVQFYASFHDDQNFYIATVGISSRPKTLLFEIHCLNGDPGVFSWRGLVWPYLYA